MKHNQIDKLFEKVREAEKRPQPQAWDRIQEELHKDSSPAKVWYKIAAVFILVSLSTLVFFYMRESTRLNNSRSISQTLPDEKEALPLKNEEKQHLRQSSPKENTVNEKALTAIVKEQKNEVFKPNSVATSKSSATTRKTQPRKDNKAEEKPASDIPDEKIPTIDAEEEAREVLLASQAVPQPTSTEALAVEQQKTALPSITIEFKSGKTPDKTALASNTEAKSPSTPLFTIKKVIEKVKDVKEGEIGLAQLREAKDDFFALDTHIPSFNSKNSKQ